MCGFGGLCVDLVGGCGGSGGGTVVVDQWEAVAGGVPVGGLYVWIW